MSSQKAPADMPKAINPLERGAEKILAQPSKGYWANIWDQLVARRAVVFGLWMFAMLVFFAVAAPLIANHRPYIAIDPVTNEQGEVIGREISFPLITALGIMDWTLIGASVYAVWAWWWRRSIKRRNGKSGRIALTLYVTSVFAAIAWSLVVVPWDRIEGLRAWWWWAGFGACALLGPAMLLSGAAVVATGRHDAFGRDLTDSAIRRLFFGALIAVVGASAFASLNRPALDRRDYIREYRMSPPEGAWALFPPIPHNGRRRSGWPRRAAWKSAFGNFTQRAGRSRHWRLRLR